MKKNLLLLFVLSISLCLSAQSLRPVDMVAAKKDIGAEFESHQLFDLNNGRQAISELDRTATTYSVLNLRAEDLRTLILEAPANLQLQIPQEGRNDLDLELVQVNIFDPGFRVVESPAEIEVEVDLGVHYRGIIRGDDRSVVAISVFEHEVMGLIANDEGNLVLGKLKGENWSAEHVLYKDAAILQELGFSCDTPDDGRGYTREELTWEPSDEGGRALTDCVRLYYEADYDIFQDKGSTNATSAFVTGIHNQMATLYGNEQINTSLSEIVVWSSTSPYSSGSSSGMLSDFQNYRNGFNGDLASLFSYQASGGIAAGFSGICNSNPDNSMCFSSINSTYSTVPTYSWTIDVATHELGHLFGSRHTHACVWNGNNTAIDGCSGSTEGSCSLPGNPPGGGTIMSYCHFNVGKDFNLGFGPQPGNVIRNSVANGNCLQACGGGGGGGGCNDTEVTLTINLDNYPGETTWTLTDGSSTLASGGPYSGAGSTVTEDICLGDGCYTFTINDSYGDGICCGYGNGSYSLTDGSTVLASGGQFGSSESTNFCLGGGGGGGGNDCTEIDFGTYPPSTYGGSQDQGTLTVIDNVTLKIEDNAWKDINLNYTVTANTVIEFEFGSTTQGEIHGIGFDSDNGISSNRTFRLFGTQNWGIGNYDTYSNVGFYTAFTIPVGQFYTGTFNRMFFVADHDASPGNGDSYFRNIKIYEGSSCGMPVAGGAELQLPGSGVASDILAYPNPTKDMVNLQFTAADDGEAQVAVYSLTGQLMQQRTIGVNAGQNTAELRVSGMAAGTYLVRVHTDQEDWNTRINVMK